MVPMRYYHDLQLVAAFRMNSLISVFASDGSVSITHGGIEMGQGINTKVAQAAAKTLGCDMDLISIKPTAVVTSANNSTTGGSFGSELCAAVSFVQGK